MAVYRTCFGCTTDTSTCPKRAAMQSAIKGLGVTSIKFECQDRTPYFHIGQRVFAFLGMGEDRDEDDFPVFATFRGTVVEDTKRGKFVVNLDHGPSECAEYTCPDSLQGNGFAKLTHSKIKPCGEPDRQVCGVCHKTKDQEQVTCHQSWGYKPHGCISEKNEIPKCEEPFYF